MIGNLLVDAPAEAAALFGFGAVAAVVLLTVSRWLHRHDPPPLDPIPGCQPRPLRANNAPTQKRRKGDAA